MVNGWCTHYVDLVRDGSSCSFRGSPEPVMREVTLMHHHRTTQSVKRRGHMLGALLSITRVIVDNEHVHICLRTQKHRFGKESTHKIGAPSIAEAGGSGLFSSAHLSANTRQQWYKRKAGKACTLRPCSMVRCTRGCTTTKRQR
jgi:hypothetical protein